MKALYVGTLTNGSTSRMRAEKLRDLDPSTDWRWINTDAIILRTSRIWQSAAYRLQTGNAVDAINETVVNYVGNDRFDLIWVDKAIFLRPGTVQKLRRASRFLVHYTPDTAFHLRRSRHFEKTVSLYDLVVTTKSFDVPEYIRLAGRDTVHLTSQGFDGKVHFPHNPAADRKKEVIFVGLAEPDRERCVGELLRNGITVRLAGIGWSSFVRRCGPKAPLIFEGESVFAENYARLLSRAWIGLGLISKRFPELHTTRTVEIPACGAILATQATPDTVKFFAPDEALFFDSYADLARRINEVFAPGKEDALYRLAERGRARVIRDGRDYENILAAILADPRIN